MNVLRRYTLRNLWENKRRTTLTIVGLILAISLITGIAVLFSSIVNTLRLDEAYMTGGYHGKLYSNSAPEIDPDIDLDTILFKEYKGFDPNFFESKRKEFYSDDPLNTMMLSLDEEGWARYEERIVKGRLPQNENEFVFSSWLDNSSLMDLGEVLPFRVHHQLNPSGEIQMTYSEEEVTLVDKEETKEMTLVGIIDLPYENVSSFSVIYTRDDTPDSDAGIYDLTLNKVNASNVSKLEQKFPDITLNHSLLNTYFLSTEDLADSIYSFFSVIITVLFILICMPIVAVFANAFGISLAERTRAMGMLSSIGATKKQLRRSVFFEAFVVGIIAIPLGILAGIGGIAITLRLISSLVDGTFFINPLALHVEFYWLLIGALAAAIMLFVSAWIPAGRVSLITPIDAIRSNRDVKLTRRRVKTSVLTKKIFGKEGELALKNLKRNNKQYRFTVISLVISLVMLLGTMTFSHYLGKVVNTETNGYNVYLSFYGRDTERLISAMDLSLELMGQEGVIEAGRRLSLYEIHVEPEREEPGYSYIPIEFVEAEVFNQIKETLPTEGSYQDDGLQLILLDGFEIITDERLVERRTIYEDRGPMSATVYQSNYLSNSPLAIDADVLGVSDFDLRDVIMGNLESPMTMVAAYPDLDVIMENLHQTDEYWNDLRVYFLASDAASFEEYLQETMEDSIFTPNYGVYNEELNHEREQNMFRFVTILVYGLITLLVLTALSNVINTLSTTYSLRMKEFAMYRSVGMGRASFNKMINFEIFFYLMKTLLYGLPLAAIFIVILYKEMGWLLGIEHIYVPWIPLALSIVALGLILVLITSLARRKIKKFNIVEILRSEIT